MRYYIPEGSELKVAISGRSGCGNTTISRMLAEILDVAFINYTFRSLAKEIGLPLKEIIERAKSDFSYDKMVDANQVALAEKTSCVLGSRLAIWMLKNAHLKVYLTASEDVRVHRILNREGGVFEEIKKFTQHRDSEDTRRYQELYGIDNTDYSLADLVIDTEDKKPEQIIEIILHTLVERKLIVQENS